MVDAFIEFFVVVFNFFKVFLSSLLSEPWGWLILVIIAFNIWNSLKEEIDKDEEKDRLKRRAKIEAEIKVAESKRQQRVKRRKLAEDKLKREELKAKQTEELLSYMPTSLSQLAPLVSRVIDNYDFSECRDSVQLLSPSEAQTVLLDYSRGCEGDYRRAITEFIESSYSTNSFPFYEEAIKEKHNQLTDKAVEIGARAIARKIGYAYKETDLPPTQVDGKKRGSALRKTKKWKDD